ncbi:MAG TPA: hypothetical protein VHX11_07795 [Acidobacteriaceae bacterium]|jgi:hypothetical protein|nr:hypothetical protein [Acidobacteriaceae bacterium]
MTDQREPCGCFDCTQARYRQSFEGQIDAGMQADRGRASLLEPAAQLNARELYKSRYGGQPEMLTFSGAMEFAEAYRDEIRRATSSLLEERAPLTDKLDEIMRILDDPRSVTTVHDTREWMAKILRAKNLVAEVRNAIVPWDAGERAPEPGK